MKKTRSLFFVFMVAVMLVTSVAGCGKATPTIPPNEKPTSVPPTATVKPTVLPALLSKVLGMAPNTPPRVIERSPSEGQELAPGGELTVTFDQPMDKTATGAAFKVVDNAQSAVDGKLTWKDNRTLVFKPGKALERNGFYQAVIGTAAKSASGVSVAEDVKLSFQTVGELHVSQVFPADGANKIESNSIISVMFNRPVVPLVIVEEMDKLPNPIEIEPAVDGKGEWVNTSLYVFRPSGYFRGGTDYRVTVRAGLLDATGDPAAALPEDYSWSFRTQLAYVASFAYDDMENPQDKMINVRLDPTLRVTFNVAMDQNSVENNLSLRNSKTGEYVPVKTEWNKEGTSITLKPTGLLDLEEYYQLGLSGDVRALDGGALDGGLTWNFVTVPYPAIRSTTPANGATNADNAFTVQFNTRIDIKSLTEDKIVFSPALENPENHWYNDWEWQVIYFNLAPSTRYTVEIKPGIKDVYGNAIKEGRVVSFTTRPLPPSASTYMPWEPIYRAGTKQSFYARYNNVNNISAVLYRLTADQFIGLKQDYQAMNNFNGKGYELVWNYNETARGSLNQRVVSELIMTEKDGSPLKPGFYYLGFDASPVQHSYSTYLENRLFVVATDNITLKNAPDESLVWVTDLTSGKPTAGADVRIFNGNYSAVANGSTDNDGLYKPQIENRPDMDYGARYALIDSGGRVGYTGSYWGAGVYPSDFGIAEQWYQSPSRLMAYLYTDRPIYRPGQPVYFKGIVRSDDDMRYSLPENTRLHLVISSYEETVYEEDIKLGEFGSFDGKFELAKETALGAYTLSLNVDMGETSMTVSSITFNVAEYRRPEFQVSASASPANVLAGDEFEAAIEASYYSGGRLSDAKVAWTLRADAYTFQPPLALQRYNFTDDEQDNWEFWWNRQPPTNGTELATGEGVTDGQGNFSIKLPADLGKETISQRLTWEATLTDFSGNSVSARAQVIAHQSEVYPGIRSSSYIGTEGKSSSFDLIAVDWAANPIANQKVDVVIVERQWYSVQEEDANGVLRWKSSVKDNPVATFEGLALDAQGRGTVSFTPAKGGVYRARISARDTRGNSASASAYIWVTGKDYIPWMQTNNRSFQVVADKDTYTPGETADILIASPFKGAAYALVTVERGRVRYQDVVLLQSNSTNYKLKISNDFAPNVFVSVVIVKGVDADNPRPNFKVGMVTLNVTTDQQKLNVSVTPDRVQTGPGEQVTYTVETTNAAGKPVQADVSLGLSDLATLSLADPNSQPPVDYFYARRGLSIRTSISITQSAEDYNNDIAEALKTADAAEGGRGGSGGGKGEGYTGVMEIREDFPDTAYWKADVVTGEDGKAQVTVTLPDNLTTWRMDARAFTADTLVGQATVDITSTKPLLIRPQTPRFFVVGDTATLGAAVHNNTGSSLSVAVSLDIRGANLDGEVTQTVEIGAQKQALVTWTVSVPPGSERVDIIFSAQGGDYKDATRPTMGTLDGQGIPVYRYETPETVGTSGMLTEAGARVEAISLPQSLDVQKGEVKIDLSPSLAAGMTDGLNYLEHYPYECTEQTVSRFLPNIRTTAALRAAGLADPMLEENLKNQVNTGLQKLYAQQNPDGGWGWWGNQESDLLTSAYVVMALAEAKDLGYPVDEDVLRLGVVYVSNGRVSVTRLAQPEVANRQAFVLYALAKAKKIEPSSATQLFEARQNLSLYARALLMQTLHMIDENDERIKSLTSDLATAAIQSAAGAHWEEGTRDWWNWNTDVRTTAIILGALIETDPGNMLNANAVRWLMSHRTQGRWESTQETAWSLLALTAWVVKTGELNAEYQYAVAFNDEGLMEGNVNKDNLRETRTLTVDVTHMLKDEINRLTLARDDGKGNLYYTAYLNVWLPADQVQALNRGVVVTRQYYRLDDLNTPVTEAAPGDLLVARLTVVASNTLHYLVVDDPLPAGLEAVDPGLKTNPTGYEPQGYDWKKIDSEGWGWWYFSHIELRDERVVLSTDTLPQGTYVYTYLVRAGTKGAFQAMPPTAQEFYFPDVYGRGDGGSFTVK